MSSQADRYVFLFHPFSNILPWELLLSSSSGKGCFQARWTWAQSLAMTHMQVVSVLTPAICHPLQEPGKEGTELLW